METNESGSMQKEVVQQVIQQHQQAIEKVQSPETNKAPAPLKDPADSFRGLPMRELISAPLIAACEAQQQLAATALNFYEKIAFDDNHATRCLEFDLERPVQSPGAVTTNKIHVKAPFIGLVPVPSLLIDNINIDFQMEITDASTSKSQDNAELSTGVTSKWFNTSVNVQGKVSTSRENTRTTNQTAKYQVSVSASQQKPTEGLSKLMDIMASCIEPIENSQ